MLSNLALAGSALVIQAERQDVTADNLANVSTAGFKRLRMGVRSVTPPNTDFQSYLSEAMGEPPNLLTMTNSRDTTPGQLVPTGNPTDLAILGPGYLVVQDAGGYAYTRDGSFQLDSTSLLVDSEGRAVLSDNNAPIRITGDSFAISEDGAVSVDGAVVARLGVVSFPPQFAVRQGNGLFTAPRAVVNQVQGPRLKQGYTEGSNVNAVQEMVQMVTDLRAFESSQKLLMAQDQLLEKTVNEVGRA